MTDRDRPGRLPSDEDRLRALLEDSVADVRPAPALDHIRSRTKVTPMRRTRPWLLVAAGAVAATAATITVVSLADPRSPEAGPGPAATTTATPSDGPSDTPVDPTPTPAPSDSSSPSGAGTVTAPPSEAPAAEPGDTVAVPVYFVGDTPTGPRLYREFVHSPAGADATSRLSTALDAAVSGTATDPDFRSDWPDGVAVTGVELPGSGDGVPAVLVTLGADSADASLAERPADLTEDDARIAVQQLVYTAQAVVQQRLPVAFEGDDGAPLDTLLGVDVSGGAEEAPAAEVQAPVWVTSPQDGDQVRRTFTVEGRGAFFEANVSWQLLRPDGSVARDGFATAEECCTLAPYSFEVTAPPGDYVLRVYDADVSGGEGPGEQEDTKRVTVR